MRHYKTLLGMTGLNIQLFAGEKIDSKVRSTTQSISNDISNNFTYFKRWKNWNS